MYVGSASRLSACELKHLLVQGFGAVPPEAQKKEGHLMADKFVPISKQSKKNQRKAAASKRNTWNGLNPVTRVPPNSKAYNRAKATAKLRRSSDD